MRQGLTDLENVMEILEETPDITDRPGAVDLNFEQGKVVFDHVSFKYRDGGTVLRDLSLAPLPTR